MPKGKQALEEYLRHALTRVQFCGLIQGEAHHLKHFNKIERCWCPENGAWAHPACHKKQHPQLQLRRIT